MNTDHAAEHARLTEKVNEYTLKAKQHAKDRQGLFFATMARAKSIQAEWHRRRLFEFPLHAPDCACAGKFKDGHHTKTFCLADGATINVSGCSGAGNRGRGGDPVPFVWAAGNFTSDTNIAQVPSRLSELLREREALEKERDSFANNTFASRKDADAFIGRQK